MRNIYFIKKISLLVSVAMLLSCVAKSQDTAVTANTVTQGSNLLEMLLAITMAVLAFVIWSLGRVLLELGKQVVEKNKISKVLPLLLTGIFLSAAQSSSAQDVAQETIQTVSNYGGMSPRTFYLFASVLGTEVIIIFFLIFFIKSFSAELLPEKKTKPVTEGKWQIWWKRFRKKLTRAVPVEKEEEVLLDHEYDGIRELDNALPPWWKFGFYITIAFSIAYLLYFHVLSYGQNPTQEYNTEMAKAKAKQEIYEANNKDKIDENNVPMADAAGLAIAKEIFTAKCFACHGAAGEGGAGPNLTDDYWLHKGSLNDIYHSIKVGYPDKGMQSWASVYTPKEISELASYVKNFHGTNPPNAKAPQGDIYVDSSAAQDSTKSAGTDSSSTGTGTNNTKPGTGN
ncbi:MAG: cbb3-type cytochrome c oxidase N-terminal domain-containing protein [Ginsengibacter sp.]